ncbi:HipA protein [Legionella hackeliae]|uniref:Uncharacterized protein n=1 Tax=Legionella hackeliae TaxID=449 RepID=A0A0A8UMP1_LEGHA|nr:protein of unknown function [Legionella hackeliae]STX46820.1 HipA protein [Legionella hackeliae]
MIGDKQVLDVYLGEDQIANITFNANQATNTRLGFIEYFDI